MKRTSTIMAPSDLGAAGTKVIDITERSQISRIAIRFSVTIATVSLMLAALRKTISKVELVDGGKVLASFTGNVSSGINSWARGRLPYTELTLTATDLAYATVYLDFGRWLYDPDFAFRPEYFANPQLRITWDEDAANTSAVANEFAVYAMVDDDPPDGGAGMMIVTRDVQTYAMAASSHTYVVLPSDMPIRSVFVYGDTVDHDVPALFDSITLDVNNGASVIYDMKVADILDAVRELGPYTYPVVLDDAVTAKDLYVPTAFRNKIAIDYDATAFVTAQSKFALPAYKGQFIDIAASVDIKAQTGIVTGYMPGGVLPLPIGDMHDPSSWLVPERSDRVELDILSSSDADSGDTAGVVVQQAMSY